ncbi:MAG: helix-turn-helix transcriptional regulator [Clostridia bacterium]|nr:helix-turn-helix transcriptional regulator [Clostridia bacterium]
MYELHKHNPTFPMTFKPFIINELSKFSPHWHENIELLHITKGRARAIIGAQEVFADAGDTIIVNTDTIHQLYSVSGDLEYYCLIIEIEFLKQVGLDFTETAVSSIVCDNSIALLFTQIASIVKAKDAYYESDVCSCALKIANILMKNYESAKNTDALNQKDAKTELVKSAITYMKKNFERNINLDDICRDVGFTKCYFCHTFKEITGMTATNMLNIIRCKEAHRILKNTNDNVLEAALKCGFSNASYFTKTYKAIMGQMPSETKKNN